MLALAIALSAIIPLDDVIRDECDLIELNHVYDCDRGTKRFTQLIFWEWESERSRYRVVDYKMLSVECGANQSRLWSIERCGQDWQARLSEGGKTRQVTATSFRESWTENDPERDDLMSWPSNARRRLKQPNNKRQ